MTESVRLHHPTFKAPPGGRLNYVVEMPNDYPEPILDCPTCPAGTVHRKKAIHLRLDENGDVLVAPGILELLRTVPTMAGLEVANAVYDAPSQIVGAVELLKTETILPDRRGWTPGRTKYESRDIMQKPLQPLLDAYLEGMDREATAKKAEKQTIFVMGRRK